MVLCKYYLQGTCRFGNRCRYEHPSDSFSAHSYDYNSGRNYGQGRDYREYQSRGQHYDRRSYDDSRSYGTRGRGDQRYYDSDYYYDSRSHYSGSSHRGRGKDYNDGYYNDRQHGDGDYRSRYTYTAGQQTWPNAYSTKSYASSADQPQTTDDLLTYIREEMEIWESSGIWPFSCFAFTREASSLPGLDDLSVEEVRLNAYEAKANGNLNAYVSWMVELSKDYAAKREQLKRPTGAVKDGLIRIIEEVSRVGVPVNTAAGQKASAPDINSGPFPSSFTANVPPSAAFATNGFDSFSAASDTTAKTFGASTANAFSGPVNVFSSPSFGQSPALPQQGSVVGAFASPAGFTTSSSQPQTTFGFAQPARVDAGQSQTANVAESRVYTPLDQLTAEDRAQYEASKFTLGRVPVQPPPKELV